MIKESYYYYLLARTVNRSVWRRSSIDDTVFSICSCTCQSTELSSTLHIRRYRLSLSGQAKRRLGFKHCRTNGCSSRRNREVAEVILAYRSGRGWKRHRESALERHTLVLCFGGNESTGGYWVMAVIIYIFIRINCSFKNQEIKITTEKETHNASKNTTCQMHTNCAQRKRKIT